jgi:predicted DNA-binding protein
MCLATRILTCIEMSNKSATLPRIRVTPEMKARVKQLAQADNRTVSDYVRLVLERHIKSIKCFEELACNGPSRPDC